MLQLATLFQLLDADESGSISFDEMQLGLQAFELRPRIQMTAEDFRQVLTPVLCGRVLWQGGVG